MEEEHSLQPIADVVMGTTISILTIFVPLIIIILPPHSNMDSIEKHISVDQDILQDPLISNQQRRHIESELADLKLYKEHNPEDHHDPTSMELYCDANPSAEECLIYDN